MTERHVVEPIDGRRLGLIALGVLAAAVAVALAVDALVTTDQERVEDIVHGLLGELTTDRIDGVCALLDPAQQPVEIETAGLTTLYDASQDPNARDVLEARVRSALSSYRGVTIRALRQSVVVEGDEARVSLQLVSREGMAQIVASLRKRGDDWLVASAHVR